jgi:hypothetical protein
VARKAGVSIFPSDRDVPQIVRGDRATIRLIAIEANGIAGFEFSGLVNGHYLGLLSQPHANALAVLGRNELNASIF